MRLKQFLTEGRGVPMSGDKAREMIGTKCSKAWKATRDGNIIYRGVSDSFSTEEAMFIEPRKFARKSANTSNWYTQIISNSPLWKKYPRRDKSLICANNTLVAGGYGRLYVVLPYDGYRIGVCPENDFWDSFEEFAPDRVNGMITMLSKLIQPMEASMPRTVAGADRNVKTAYQVFDAISNFYRKNPVSAVEAVEIPPMFSHPDRGKGFKPGDDFRKFLEEQFAPDKNNFKVVKAGDNLPSASDMREVWTDAPSILYRADYIKDLEI